MSNEGNVTTCRKCKELKVRIQDGNYDHKNKRYRDEKGVLWSGRTCPDCHREQMAERQKEKRQDAKKGLAPTKV